MSLIWLFLLNLYILFMSSKQKKNLSSSVKILSFSHFTSWLQMLLCWFDLIFTKLFSIFSTSIWNMTKYLFIVVLYSSTIQRGSFFLSNIVILLLFLLLVHFFPYYLLKSLYCVKYKLNNNKKMIYWSIHALSAWKFILNTQIHWISNVIFAV